MTFEVKTLADGVNNALYLYGQAINANYFGCENPLPQKLRELPHEELDKRYKTLRKFYETLLKIEADGMTHMGIGIEGGQIYVDC